MNIFLRSRIFLAVSFSRWKPDWQRSFIVSRAPFAPVFRFVPHSVWSDWQYANDCNLNTFVALCLTAIIVCVDCVSIWKRDGYDGLSMEFGTVKYCYALGDLYARLLFYQLIFRRDRFLQNLNGSKSFRSTPTNVAFTLLSSKTGFWSCIQELGAELCRNHSKFGWVLLQGLWAFYHLKKVISSNIIVSRPLVHPLHYIRSRFGQLGSIKFHGLQLSGPIE